ncbi:hypothetical protein, partial [Ochrobactrum sp. POC9]|uniref:hypothetical protein n=1 Tax=Ochrobactrum sp. POC9 TaxID=2203419 RepID=UPI001AEC8AD9
YRRRDVEATLWRFAASNCLPGGRPVEAVPFFTALLFDILASDAIFIKLTGSPLRPFPWVVKNFSEQECY